jgi:hypothetical protein
MAPPHRATRRSVCHCGAIGDVSSRLGSVVLQEASTPLTTINTSTITVRRHRKRKECTAFITAFHRIRAACVKTGHS